MRVESESESGSFSSQKKNHQVMPNKLKFIYLFSNGKWPLEEIAAIDGYFLDGFSLSLSLSLSVSMDRLKCLKIEKYCGVQKTNNNIGNN